MILGTRGSRLALAQSNMVLQLMKGKYPQEMVELKIISTVGDRVHDQPLASLGGFGAFVKELDNKILSGEIDIAVNSLKDMPVVPTEGTVIAAILPRGHVETGFGHRHVQRQAEMSAAEPASGPGGQGPERQRPDPAGQDEGRSV